MKANLQSYYFKNMSTTVADFIRCCYACFLSNKSNRKTKIGIYPTPSAPLEEVMMDLAENLNNIGGYSHLLVTQCVLTDFTILVPLKTKQASEVNRQILNCLFQQFNIKRIHTDNGPAFRSTAWLETLAALKIQVIGSSALHPSGRGQIERLVGTIKVMLKKMLAVKSDLNWEFLPYLVAKILNNSVSPKTGFKPVQMVFGNQSIHESIFDTETVARMHPMIANNKQIVDKLTTEIKSMVDAATSRLTQIRLIENEKRNRTRLDKKFKVNDYVFVLDRMNVPGSTRPLKTRFHPSPYIVIRPLFTTTLVQRLADGFIALYSNDDLKRYDGRSPYFSNIPKEVARALLHDFQDLLVSDLADISRHDKLDLPTGIKLFDPDEDYTVKNSDSIVNETEPESQPKQALPPDEFTPSLETKDPELEIEDIIKNLSEPDRLDLQKDLEELNNYKSNIEIPTVPSDSDSDEEEPEAATGIKLRSGRRVQFK